MPKIRMVYTRDQIIRVLLMLKDNKFNINKTSDETGIHRGTLTTWKKKYRKELTLAVNKKDIAARNSGEKKKKEKKRPQTKKDKIIPKAIKGKVEKIIDITKSSDVSILNNEDILQESFNVYAMMIRRMTEIVPYEVSLRNLTEGVKIMNGVLSEKEDKPEKSSVNLNGMTFIQYVNNYLSKKHGYDTEDSDNGNGQEPTILNQ